ncbi:IS200/IS605 family transposase [Streptomyces sp. NPDC001508]|uniref:IS200/IS605 family transposase n=1 Tax=Streptomyces sp. NPDC001508 TaxID=3154656 RepID=UPI0033313B27
MPTCCGCGRRTGRNVNRAVAGLGSLRPDGAPPVPAPARASPQPPQSCARRVRPVPASSLPGGRRQCELRGQPASREPRSTDFGAEPREFDGEADHVHLLVYCPALGRTAHARRSLKGVSARRLRQHFPDHVNKYLRGEHFWTPSYAAGSCGGAPLAVVKEHIENQNARTERGFNRGSLYGATRRRSATPGSGCNSSRV